MMTKHPPLKLKRHAKHSWTYRGSRRGSRSMHHLLHGDCIDGLIGQRTELAGGRLAGYAVEYEGVGDEEDGWIFVEASGWMEGSRVEERPPRANRSEAWKPAGGSG